MTTSTGTGQDTRMNISIRPARPTDRDIVLRLAVDNQMFAPDELDDLGSVFDDTSSTDEHHWAVAEAEGGVVGAAYWAPEPFADRLWNLFFIATAPDRHGSGVGSMLTEHLESALRALGPERARVLLVDTSSTEQYVGARRFYLGRGFVEEARIREFYGEGDDKVTFWKRIDT
ncbi:MAG: GNAT family N-acetyltransferase [Dermatophilaceae bacterium]